VATEGLSGLGEQIRSWVDESINQAQQRTGQRPGVSAGVAGLTGLGDRIRSAVARSSGDVSLQSPGGGGTGLGTMATQIMNHVRSNLPPPGAQAPSPGLGGGAAPTDYPNPHAAASQPPLGQGTVTAGNMTPGQPNTGYSAVTNGANGITPMPPLTSPNRLSVTTPGTVTVNGVQQSLMGGGYQPPVGTAPPPPTPLPNAYGPTGQPLGGMETMPAVTSGTDWRQVAQQTGGTTPAQDSYLASAPQGTGLTAPPQQVVPGNVGAPQGTIQTPGLQIAYGRGGSWDQVNQYDAAFTAAGAANGVDPAMLKAMAVIESGGQMIPNAGGSGAYGIMQIKASDWQADADRLGIDLTTPEGQIQMAGAILGGKTSRTAGMDPETAFLEAYYPVRDASGNICLTCQGEDGATPQQYLDDMHLLMADINAAGGGTPTGPAPVEPGSPGSLGMGGYPPLVPGAQGTLGAGTALDPNNPATAGGGLIAPPTTVGGGNPNGTTPGIYTPAPVQRDITYQPTGAVGHFGGPGDMEPKAVMDEQSTAYLDALYPGAAQETLNGAYGFGAPDGCIPRGSCYDDYYNWDPNFHPGEDVYGPGGGAEGASVNSLVSGHVVCKFGAGQSADTMSGCGAYGDESRPIYDANGAIIGYESGNLSIQTDDGAIVTYGHTNSTPLEVGDPVTAGQAVGAMGIGGGAYHTHLEVRLPIGPNGEYTLVDPNNYFNGYYCDQGFCPDAAAPAQPGLQQPPGKVEQSYAAQPAPAAAAPAAEPMPAPSYYDTGTAAPTTGQVTTDAAGRQYEIMADGTTRLIYDPAW